MDGWFGNWMNDHHFSASEVTVKQLKEKLKELEEKIELTVQVMMMMMMMMMMVILSNQINGHVCYPHRREPMRKRGRSRNPLRRGNSRCSSGRLNLQRSWERLSLRPIPSKQVYGRMSLVDVIDSHHRSIFVLRLTFGRDFWRRYV